MYKQRNTYKVLSRGNHPLGSPTNQDLRNTHTKINILLHKATQFFLQLLLKAVARDHISSVPARFIRGATFI